MSLMEYLPPFYENIKEFQEIAATEDEEISQIRFAMEDLLKQFFIDTATWGVTYWENEYGIKTDQSKSLEQRRSAVKAKRRGVGTVTKALVKSVANSFDNGEVEVIEKPEIDEIEIKFNSIRGVPSNVDDLKNALEKIVPAHLEIVYSFNFLTMGELSSYDFSMSQMTLMNMTMAEWSVYRD
jgi:hypothetical protein